MSEFQECAKKDEQVLQIRYQRKEARYILYDAICQKLILFQFSVSAILAHK